MATTLKSKVIKGAKILDALRSGWARKINMTNLDLEDCDECIIGQLFGEYLSKDAELLTKDALGADLGYDLLPQDDRMENWENLARLWKEQIRKRRN